ncbi:helix-turn-helix domain-containing protein [Pseudonocardia spirodelae]|uniref:Helix-turn-helix domain-containing protein n=1 Tax=Pseudonocardia spirodelae TaxID=3133431 RepID=A0ABU8T9C7_9PSEU
MTQDPSHCGAQRISFRTDSPYEVERFASEFYSHTVVRPPADGREFEMGQETVLVSTFSMSELWIVGSIDAQVEPVDRTYAVDVLHDGSMCWGTEAYGEVQLGPGDVGVLPPQGRFTDLAEDVDLDVVHLDAAAVARYAAQAYGVDGERFRLAGITPVSAAHARRWAATVVDVRDHVLGNPMLLDGPVAVAEAFDRLTSTFLATFPSTVPDTARTDDGAALPARLVRRVSEHLRRHAHRPVGPADLARVTGGPARAAVAGMRRAGVDPAQVLWRARLDGVRAELRAGSGQPVAVVAARWGFARFGRFRVAYTRTFGETPEQTAR